MNTISGQALTPSCQRRQCRPFLPGSALIPVKGVALYVRTGGDGPAVVLLHGYGETGDMWAPLAAELARDHTVIAPDLRGMGLTSRPEGGYDKKVQGHDIAGMLDALQIDRADLVTHDIGKMVGYAFAVQYPERVTRFVIMDAPRQASDPGKKSSASVPYGISRSKARMRSGSPIASGTSSQPTLADSARHHASTMPRSTHSPVRSMPASTSLLLSTRTPATTRPLSPRGS
jgi:pimeloyl-ACP methyl ester carboxylesterase